MTKEALQPSDSQIAETESSPPDEKEKKDIQTKAGALARIKVLVRFHPFTIVSAMNVSSGLWDIMQKAGVIIEPPHPFAINPDSTTLILNTPYGPYKMIINGSILDKFDIIVVKVQ